ncbi:MAG: peptidylprolyl isomerase [Dehalococcoidales bacterium]|nr:peptidylprolyl isomerase [Dehalococcoidales bacterium]
MIKRKPIILLAALLLGTALFGFGCSGGATAKSGDTVKVDYTGKLSDGTVFDSSEDSEPLEFTLGQNQVIVGFEKAVTGMKVGESKTVTIPADEAYGQPSDDLILVVDRSQMPQGLEIKEGQQLQATNSDGTTSVFTVTKIDATTVTVDGNNALAGKDLTFDIKLVEIVAK